MSILITPALHPVKVLILSIFGTEIQNYLLIVQPEVDTVLKSKDDVHDLYNYWYQLKTLLKL